MPYTQYKGLVTVVPSNMIKSNKLSTTSHHVLRSMTGGTDTAFVSLDKQILFTETCQINTSYMKIY